MENLKHIFGVPEEVAKAREMLEQGKLLEVKITFVWSIYDSS